MDRNEYASRLSGFEDLVNTARMQSAILETMIKEDDDTVGVLNTYKAFFLVVRASLHNGMLLEAAKALDRDARAASLPNLVGAARDCPQLAPGVDIAAIEAWIKKHTTVIKDLQTLRNKRLAHFDVPAQLPGGLLYGQFIDLLEDLRGHWLDLYRAFHGVAAVMDRRADEARAHTDEIRKTLISARRARIQKHQPHSPRDSP